MSAYNSINGEWCGQNAELLTDILRDEWAFGGFVISDFIFGVRDAACSLAADLDIEMPFRMVRAQHLAEALERGEARWADVDTAVTRIVAILLRFDGVLSQVPAPRVVGSPEHRALAREAAARSVVLLRNEPVGGTPVLPLPGGSALALIGRLGDAINLGDGGSSDVWDVDCHTILDGLRTAAGTVTYDDGADVRRAAAVAAAADAAIVVVGYTYLDEASRSATAARRWRSSSHPAMNPRCSSGSRRCSLTCHRRPRQRTYQHVPSTASVTAPRCGCGPRTSRSFVPLLPPIPARSSPSNRAAPS